MLVSMSPCFCVLCAIFVALLGLVWVRARKSSPCGGVSSCSREKVRPAHSKHPKFGVFAPCWASFFAEMPLEGPRWASFFAPWVWQLGAAAHTPLGGLTCALGGNGASRSEAAESHSQRPLRGLGRPESAGPSVGDRRGPRAQPPSATGSLSRTEVKIRRSATCTGCGSADPARAMQ